MSTAVMFQGWASLASLGSIGWRRIANPGPQWVPSGPEWWPPDVLYVLDDVAAPPIAPAPPVEVTGVENREPWRWRVGGMSVVILSRALELGATVGPWEGLGPRELVSAFAHFERLVGVPWGDSVGRTAEAVILAGHPIRKGGRRLDIPPNVPEPARDNGLELPYTAWRRPLTAAEQGARWVHMFDANAQYLAAWGSTELGHGHPVHHRAPAFDSRAVGVWRLEGVDNLRLPSSPLLPPVWTPGREWYTTATVVRLLEVCEGYDAPIPAEAWLWPNRSRFLRPAGEKLRDARAGALSELETAREGLRRACLMDELPDPDTWAQRVAVAESIRQAIGQLYQIQTGRFGMGRRDPKSGWARPDWGNMVRAQARVNLHRRLSKLTAAPFAIATDGLLFATDEPDGLAFAEQIGLSGRWGIGQGLGQYKYEGSAELGKLDLGASILDLFEAVGDG